MESNEMYIKAAKIIATCPAKRLPAVLSVLEKGGIVFTNEELEKMKLSAAHPSKTDILISNRKEQKKEEWKETDNEYIIRLREAYDKGVSITQISRIVGVNKATAYKYLWGWRTPSRCIGEKIVEACNSLGF